MLDSDMRTYATILRLLRAFGAESISLRKLIADLESLLASLPTTEGHWKGRMSKDWAILEDIFADALDRNLTDLPDDYKKMIRDAVRDLEGVTLERINALAAPVTGENLQRGVE